MIFLLNKETEKLRSLKGRNRLARAFLAEKNLSYLLNDKTDVSLYANEIFLYFLGDYFRRRSKLITKTSSYCRMQGKIYLSLIMRLKTVKSLKSCVLYSKHFY